MRLSRARLSAIGAFEIARFNKLASATSDVVRNRFSCVFRGALSTIAYIRARPIARTIHYADAFAARKLLPELVARYRWRPLSSRHLRPLVVTPASTSTWSDHADGSNFTT
jgi:hypothetical protein